MLKPPGHNVLRPGMIVVLNDKYRTDIYEKYKKQISNHRPGDIFRVSNLGHNDGYPVLIPADRENGKQYHMFCNFDVHVDIIFAPETKKKK